MILFSRNQLVKHNHNNVVTDSLLMRHILLFFHIFLLIDNLIATGTWISLVSLMLSFFYEMSDAFSVCSLGCIDHIQKHSFYPHSLGASDVCEHSSLLYT